jgi:hypothetical protein
MKHSFYLDAASQSGLKGLDTKPTMSIRLSERANRVLSNILSLFMTGTRADRVSGSAPKPVSALRMMTAGEEAGRNFWGPCGIFTKFIESVRTDQHGAPRARQFLGPRRNLDDRLLRQGRRGVLGARRQAGRGDSSASRPSSARRSRRMRSRRARRGGAPQPMPPARPRPLPAAAKRPHPTQAPDGGGDLTLDEVQPLFTPSYTLTRSLAPSLSDSPHTCCHPLGSEFVQVRASQGERD